MSKYVAMINMSGFMPDRDDLATFTNKKDCLAYLEEEVNDAFDQSAEGYAGIERLESDLQEAIKHLKRHGYCYFLGYYFGANKQ